MLKVKKLVECFGSATSNFLDFCVAEVSFMGSVSYPSRESVTTGRVT